MKVSAVAAETPADAPEPLELPTDRPRSAQPDHAWALVRMELDEELVASPMALGLRRGARISSVLLAGWAAVLSRLSGQTDLVIGTSSRGWPSERRLATNARRRHSSERRRHRE